MKHFKLEELVDRTTFETLGNKAWSLFSEEVLFALDDFREYINAPVTVNDWARGGSMQWRGYRTPKKAKEFGAAHSQHAFTFKDGLWIPLCNAFDCTVKGYSAPEARAEILAHQDNELLKRITRLEANVSWVHLDCGAVPEGKQRIYLFQA